jgi:hypothetical protein
MEGRKEQSGRKEMEMDVSTSSLGEWGMVESR